MKFLRGVFGRSTLILCVILCQASAYPPYGNIFGPYYRQEQTQNINRYNQCPNYGPSYVSNNVESGGVSNMAVGGGTININGQQTQVNGRNGEFTNNYAANGGTINNHRTNYDTTNNIQGDMVTNNIGSNYGGLNRFNSFGNRFTNNQQTQNSQNQYSNNNYGRFW